MDTLEINKELLERVISVLGNLENIYGQEQKIEKEKIEKIKFVLEEMKQSENCWKDKCLLTYKINIVDKHGYIISNNSFQKLIKKYGNISNQANIDNELLDSVLILTMQFMREAMLSIYRQGERKIIFRNEEYQKEFIDRWKWFKELSSSQIHNKKRNLFEDVRNNYDAEITSFYTGISKDSANDAQASLKEINEIHKEINKIYSKEKFKKDIEELSGGFKNLLKVRRRKGMVTFFILIIISIIILYVPIYALYTNYDIKLLGGVNIENVNIKNISSIKGIKMEWFDIFLQKIIPLLSLEFILIYLFRVVLEQYKIIQTQIMQIELRISLCQFSKSYSTYAKTLRDKNEGAMNKFENIIFSNITANEEKVPNIFDGLEVIKDILPELNKLKETSSKD